MIKAKIFSVLVLLLATAHAQLRKQENLITCRVMYIHVLGNDADDRLECEIIAGGAVGHGYTVELPAAFVDDHQELLMKGEWYILVPDARVEYTYVKGYGAIGSRLHISDPSRLQTISPPVEAQKQRGLATTGQRSLMVVRVSVSDSSPTYSASQLQQWYFDPNSFSVARQYSRCSSGQQVFTPWTIPVLDVFVAGTASSFTQATLVNAAITAVQNALGGTTLPVQHIAFILPPGSPSFVAVGQVRGWRSTYYDTFGGIPDTAMHELGHNLGLGHAGVPGDEYGDFTSLMGYGELGQFAPSKCFNACDHLNFGWFTDRTIIVDPSQGQQIVNLATFVDYSSTSSSQPVVLKIGSYCLSYNRAKGVNFETEDAVDQVTVAIAATSFKSTRLDALDETTPPYTQANYNGGAQQLVIQVCSRATAGNVDYATVAIGLGTTGCGPQPTPVIAAPAPTFAPVTNPPTTFPTPPPTLHPTAQPTVSTSKPTQKPTSLPTNQPTPAPVALATPPPTLHPTAQPTLSTPKPTQKPTSLPTNQPTPAPVALAVVPAPFAVLINAGSNSAYTGGNGVTWSADQFFSGGNGFQQLGATITNTGDAALYQTQRLGQVQYNIPVPKISNYQVVLMFAEIDPNAQAKGSRVFDIYFQGALAYNHFDIFSAAGGGFKAVSLRPAIAVVNGMLKISFVSQVNLPLIAAIKVVPY